MINVKGMRGHDSREVTTMMISLRSRKEDLRRVANKSKLPTRRILDEMQRIERKSYSWAGVLLPGEGNAFLAAQYCNLAALSHVQTSSGLPSIHSKACQTYYSAKTTPIPDFIEVANR